MEITISVNKANVYDEVAKTTAYVGAKKMTEDVTAYDRIFTTDEDRLLLERFWVETCGVVTEQFKPFIVSVDSQPVSHGIDLTRNYKVTLDLSSAFDESLTESISTTLHSLFVSSLVGKWFAITNQVDVERYVAEAAGAMESILKMVYFRKRPSRATM